MKPKARYGHSMSRVDSRVFMFGGENNTSLANDLWTLRGLGLDDSDSPAWIPLELPGSAPAPRKGHTCTGMQSQPAQSWGCYSVSAGSLLTSLLLSLLSQAHTARLIQKVTSAHFNASLCPAQLSCIAMGCCAFQALALHCHSSRC